MKVLVTGGAGFIGSQVSRSLLDRGDDVVVIDEVNDYYDPKIKRDRISKFLNNECAFYEIDFSDVEALKRVFEEHKFDAICHLGAQAGVRYSIENPMAYEIANNVGTLNLLEMARHNNIKNFIFASSSSVYGNNKKQPFSEKDSVDTPISLYAATKKYNELMAHTYHHLYGINCTGLRFFTVYGPWGRPDMALFLFVDAIMKDKPINVFNNGEMQRNFTYVTDIVSGVISAIDKAYPYEIFNLGGDETVGLMEFIEEIESACGKKAIKNMMPLQPGDVPATVADISHARDKLGFEPKVGLREGIEAFVKWYKEYY